MDARALWANFAKGDEAARETLLKDNLSLVYHVARQLMKSLAADADLDDLVNSGVFGLMSAMQAFDSSRGLAFSTFAVPRIRGAILDELRKQDHVPRSVRRKTRDIARGREALMRVLGREPTDKELAEHLAVDTKTLWRWQAEVEATVQVPLDRTSSDRDDDMPAPSKYLADEHQEGADAKLSREQEVVLLREAILKLKEQERTVLSLYYFEELKLHQIATILGLTESRVSQICAKALRNLREHLAPLRASA